MSSSPTQATSSDESTPNDRSASRETESTGSVIPVRNVSPGSYSDFAGTGACGDPERHIGSLMNDIKLTESSANKISANLTKWADETIPDFESSIECKIDKDVMSAGDDCLHGRMEALLAVGTKIEKMVTPSQLHESFIQKTLGKDFTLPERDGPVATLSQWKSSCSRGKKKFFSSKAADATLLLMQVAKAKAFSTQFDGTSELTKNFKALASDDFINLDCHDATSKTIDGKINGILEMKQNYDELKQKRDELLEWEAELDKINNRKRKVVEDWIQQSSYVGKKYLMTITTEDK